MYKICVCAVGLLCWKWVVSHTVRRWAGTISLVSLERRCEKSKRTSVCRVEKESALLLGRTFTAWLQQGDRDAGRGMERERERPRTPPRKRDVSAAPPAHSTGGRTFRSMGLSAAAALGSALTRTNDKSAFGLSCDNSSPFQSIGRAHGAGQKRAACRLSMLLYVFPSFLPLFCPFQTHTHTHTPGEP